MSARIPMAYEHRDETGAQQGANLCHGSLGAVSVRVYKRAESRVPRRSWRLVRTSPFTHRYRLHRNSWMSQADANWAGAEVQRAAVFAEECRRDAVLRVCNKSVRKGPREKNQRTTAVDRVRELRRFVAQQRVHSDGPRFSRPHPLSHPIALARAMPRNGHRTTNLGSPGGAARSSSYARPGTGGITLDEVKYVRIAVRQGERASLYITLDVVEGPGRGTGVPVRKRRPRFQRAGRRSPSQRVHRDWLALGGSTFALIRPCERGGPHERRGACGVGKAGRDGLELGGAARSSSQPAPGRQPPRMNLQATRTRASALRMHGVRMNGDHLTAMSTSTRHEANAVYAQNRAGRRRASRRETMKNASAAPPPSEMVRSVVGAEPCRTWTKGEAVGHYRAHQGLHIVIEYGELIHTIRRIASAGRMGRVRDGEHRSRGSCMEALRHAEELS
ncbi:hypothetical protein B0H14DRAFT_3590818 [Mycena olivaceomarginata]|nr:hypothetical protein B0H14DRAFT_3590818 [Mycena olivaceomarginata]